MNNSWPFGSKELHIGILGMTEGNGHPYSWSAIFNHYDKAKMEQCPFPGIPVYLNKQPDSTLGISGAFVTHICCDNKSDSEDAARCSHIPHVVDKPEDMIANVDAVICATDIGSEHVARCRPFLEAGIPMFIDKPLTDNEEDLKTFVKWHDEGKRFISSSSLRYSKALEPYYENHFELGKLLYICQPMCKKWETYGIHALEAVFPFLGEGFVSIQNTGTNEKNMLHLTHKSGCDVHIPLCADMYAGFGKTLLIGSRCSHFIDDSDSYYPFKKQMVNFVEWLRTGNEPFAFTETIELTKLVIGGIRSLREEGRRVFLKEIII